MGLARIGLYAYVSSPLRHVREAELEWRIRHPPFWRAALGRLRELRPEVGLQEAVRLLAVLARLGPELADAELVDHCERLLSEAEGEALLDVRDAELARAAEALGAVGRPDAMALALRPVIGRAHRLEGRLLVRLVRAARAAECPAAAELSDAAARALVERGNAEAAVLAAAASEAAALQAPAGPRSGLELLLQHCVRRAREAPEAFPQAALARVGRAAKACGQGAPEPQTAGGASGAVLVGVPGPGPPHRGAAAAAQGAAAAAGGGGGSGASSGWLGPEPAQRASAPAPQPGLGGEGPDRAPLAGAEKAGAGEGT
ncbi:unnamed protein product, partial [Prorocentrum cordatum]